MLVKAFSWIVAGTLIASAGILGKMASERSVPIQILEDDLLTPQVLPGGQLERRVKIIQDKRCAIRSDRAIYDAEGARYLLPPLELPSGNVAPIGEEVEFVIIVEIPGDIAVGPARFESVTMFRCNLLHWIWPVYGSYNPIEFEVINGRS